MARRETHTHRKRKKRAPLAEFSGEEQTQTVIHETPVQREPPEFPPVGTSTIATRSSEPIPSFMNGPIVHRPESTIDTRGDEDQWEIGERTVPTEYPPSPSSLQRQRRAILLIGLIIGVLAALGWIGSSLLRRPALLPLVLTRAEPRAEAVKVTEGESLS